MRVEEFRGFRRAKASVKSNAPCCRRSHVVLVPEGRWERNSDLVGALMGRVVSRGVSTLVSRHYFARLCLTLRFD